MKQERVLVISAHALDFLWRCGGTIAKYADSGSAVRIINLTNGVRGESNALWKNDPNASAEHINAIRKAEAEAAADMLGAEILFMGWQDHMLEVTLDRTLQLAKEMMAFAPTILLTHFTEDPMNPDHCAAAKLTIEAFRCAQTSGVFPDKAACTGTKMFMFEPAYPEVVGYAPDVYIDITASMARKMEAMQAGGAQKMLAQSYDKRNGYRGHLAGKLSGNMQIQYAETFQRFKPYVGEAFC